MHRCLTRMTMAVCLISLTCSLRSQSIPIPFAKSQTGEFRKWLDSTGLHQYLRLDTIRQEEDSPLTAYFIARGMQNWVGLDHSMDSIYHTGVGETLFDRFTFQFDLPKDNGKIVVDAGDALLILRNRNRRLSVDTLIAQSAGENFPEYTFSALRMINAPSTFKSRRSLTELKTRIKNYCYDHFKDYNGLQESYSFEDLSQDPETLRLVVSNLKKAVLREGYFEHLDLTFGFKREGEWTQVSFIMDGKYGKVVQWTAFDDRYKSMIPDYQNEVGQFIIFMGDKIINLGK